MPHSYDEFERQLKLRRWPYDVEDEVFLDGERRIDHEELLALMPDWTHDHVAAFQDAKYDQLRSRLAKQPK